MYIKTYHLQKDKPPSKIISWCLRNNLSSGRVADHNIPLVEGKYNINYSLGCLRTDLKDSLKNKRGTLLIAHKNGILLGWSLIITTPYTNTKHLYQCYVLPSQRRKGVGTKLLNKALLSGHNLRVLPDKRNKIFFKTYGLTTRSSTISNKILQRKLPKL